MLVTLSNRPIQSEFLGKGFCNPYIRFGVVLNVYVTLHYLSFVPLVLWYYCLCYYYTVMCFYDLHNPIASHLVIYYLYSSIITMIIIILPKVGVLHRLTLSPFRVWKVQGAVPTKNMQKRTLVTFFDEKSKKKERTWKSLKTQKKKNEIRNKKLETKKKNKKTYPCAFGAKLNI